MKLAKTLLLVGGLPLLTLTGAASAADPAKKADDSWISVSGTVVSAGPESFRLDHGSGVITVEMDDFDFYAEGRQLLTNDEVVVYGLIDDDLFEKKTIEASSVYVENLGTHFYASAADEEDFGVWTVRVPLVAGQMEVTGLVTSKDGRRFTIDTGLRKVTVDTAGMSYNPLDDSGYLKVDVGDQLKVGGDLDRSFFGDHVLDADWLIKLKG